MIEVILNDRLGKKVRSPAPWCAGQATAQLALREGPHSSCRAAAPCLPRRSGSSATRTTRWATSRSWWQRRQVGRRAGSCLAGSSAWQASREGGGCCREEGGRSRRRPTLAPPGCAGTRPEKIRIQKWYTVYKVRGVERASAKRVSWHTVSTCWTAHAAGQQRLPRSPPFTAKCRLLLQDHITLSDYEIHDGMGLELYYN